jgi:polysaccharide pyruvyl transferase WcaK-like protein
MRKRILLTGYYGFGNLGDDLLFICNYRLLERIYPGSLIHVFTDSPDPSYLETLVDKSLTFLNSQSSGDYDIIWHGGGGVYFDFKEGNKRSLWINRMIRVISPKNFSSLYRTGKKIAGKPLINFKHRIGMGIGVGKFTASSEKYRSKIQQLCTFDRLVVRDEESRRNALLLCSKLKVEVATDIVLDTEQWMPAIKKEDVVMSSKRIGIILRDWTFSDGNNYLDEVFDTLLELKKQGYSFTYFAFDSNTDQEYINYFTKKGEVVNVWDPKRLLLSDYLKLLLEQDIYLTSRFHGAIVGACLGIPGVCINIEPKLKSVIALLPNSYKIADFPLKDSISKKVNELNDIHGKASRLCQEDVAVNKQILEKVYSQLENQFKATSLSEKS